MISTRYMGVWEENMSNTRNTAYRDFTSVNHIKKGIKRMSKFIVHLLVIVFIYDVTLLLCLL